MTKKLLSLCFFVFLLFISLNGFGQTVTINTTGGGNFTVPAGVNSLTLQARGAGGAGGGTSGTGGGGGAGGTYASLVLAVTPGQVIPYYVGAGVAGGRNDGATGEATWFNSVGTLYAQGGAGGAEGNGGIAAGGTGSTALSVGATLIAGTNGIDGSATASGAGGAGGNGGGVGGAASTGNGNAGAIPGGGGGGAFRTNGSPKNGGAGGRGRLVITYVVVTGPSNDLCANATALPCGTNNLAGTTVGTTNVAHGTGCTVSNYGVWYTFVGNGDQTTITSTAGAGFDHEMNITSGTNCNTMANIACLDGEGTAGTETYTFITTNGTTYRVYIAHWSSGSTSTGTFTISRTCTPVTAPPNDAICSATPAPVNADLLCGSTVPGTVEFASNSGINPCAGTADDDVWYSFVATATSHNISLLNVAGSTTDLYHAVYSGACGTPTLVAGSCSDPNTSTVTGLTPGNTYFIQVYSWSSATHNSTFDLCIGTQPPCPTPNASPGPITFGTITDVSINGSFPAATPIPNNYIVIRSTTATAPTLANGTTYTIGQTFGLFTVVDTDTNTNFTATGLTQTTPYYFFIFSMNNVACIGGPVYSNTSLNGNASTVAPSYCIPSSTSTTDYIDNFSTSGGVTNISHVNSGFSPGGYGNFTAQSVTQYPGSTINFNATFVGGTFSTRIWVDWNNDLDFLDANELVYDQTGYANPTNGSFTVLAAAVAGNYRMRVRSDWGNTTLSSCGYDDESETHDYTLVVTPLNCIANPLSLMAVTTSSTTATISWTAPAPAPVNGYQYIISPDNSTATPAGDITGTTAATSINLTGLALGTTYYVFIRGLCTPPDVGVWITTTFTTGCGDVVTTPTVCPIIIDVQGTNPFTANPFIADPTASLGCTSPSVNLVANSNLRETTSYIVEQITYPSPAPEYNFPLLGGPGQAIPNDDVWADTWTNIGFNFCFYNETYTQTLVGANGAITFDSTIVPGSLSGYAFSNNIPSIAGALFEKTIYGVYQDLDPSGLVGTPIKSRLVGTVPGCRQFQVAWNNIPLFSDATRLYTGMIVLHETTNIIEVFIKEKHIENGNVNPWNGGNALVGIQGDITPLAPNNQALAAPCRNSLDTNWETTNEAWRFTPNGAVIVPASITWYQGSVAPGNIVASNPDNSLTVLTGNTYYVEANYNNLCGVNITLTDEIVVTDGRKTWNGSVSTNWATAANWTPAVVPTPVDCITIPVTARNPIINGTTDGDGYSLLILAGATLTAQPNSSLTIVDQVNVNAGATFTLENSSSLIQVNNVANTGEIIMNRNTDIRQLDYVYWSSPVNNFPVTSVSPGTPASKIYEWIPTIYVGPGPMGVSIEYGNWANFSGTMTNGKGYIIRGPNAFTAVPQTFTAIFQGLPNNGDISTGILRGNYNGLNYVDLGGIVTAQDDNWNLLGNPYPSAIDARPFLTLNTNIEGAVHLWTHGTAISAATGDPFYDDYGFNYSATDYLTYNLTGPSDQNGYLGKIASGQSFMVAMNHADATPGTVTFNNSMRSKNHINNQFFRQTSDTTEASTDDEERNRIWLDLISPANLVSKTLVGYVTGATMAKDRLYDAYVQNTSGVNLYSLIGEETMVIQGRTIPFDDQDLVPLGVSLPTDGIYTLAIDGVDGLFESPSQLIFIEDKALNLIHNIRNAPYVFTVTETGTFNDRFVLRYTNQSLGIENVNSNSGLTITAPNGDYIKVVSSNATISSLLVYDVLGRVLLDKKGINQSEFIVQDISLSDGTYIVKATLSNGKQKVQKLVLKR